jgi:hypothetical protein
MTLCWIVVLALAPATPQGAPAAARHDAASAPVAAGGKALAEGRRADAAGHFVRALEAAPDSIEVLGLLVEASSEDPDARALWLHALMTAAVAPNGSVALDGDLKKKLPADDPRPAQVAALRAAAVEELLKLAREKEKEAAQKVDAALVAQWGRRAALDLARESPALLKGREGDLSPRLAPPESLPAKVVKSLESFASGALANGRTAEAIESARILAGLATQLSFEKDLQGPRPSGLTGLGERSSSLLVRTRQQLAGRIDPPWTVDELLALDGDEAEAFTRAHDTFADPGVATSPREWYRIETDCGFQTLLGVAQTIEQHHQRLANWYGQDPFAGRAGLVRVVPEAAGLESEGVPFWWAGGFQSGDLTTVRFSCGSIEGLGRALTHELTHRFDGAIFPGLPAWLMEGRAVWTGDAYRRAADEQFVEARASIGTIEAAFIKGYGDARNLTRLIEGTIDDYRDNYVAGYALYVFLQSRRSASGRLPFRERLQKFMKEARGTKKWKEPFEGCFCDGHDERPKGFDAFVADWAPWLAGFYWQNRQPWAKEYDVDVGGGGGGLVMDEPTWVWSRHRAEPRFGQEQAALAGELFLAARRRADAIAALVWALAVDGRRPEQEAKLAAALQAEGRREAAWVLERGIEFPCGATGKPPPFAAAVQKTLALAEALEAASADAEARGFKVTAAALRSDRERLAAWLGLKTSAAAATAAPAAASGSLHPLDPPARPLALPGWTEAGLTDYEERRAKGRWYVDEDGDLHIGREKPRQATGTVDRAAAQVDCFALAPDWILPGTWRLDARIRFTTSFVNGAVIFGYAEREQNLRFTFSAGDFLYATGASEKEPEFNEMGWSLEGLRDRDGGLPGSTWGGAFAFGARASSFELALLVDGAFVEASINGRPVGRYHAADGAAIEGRIGFATSMGAIEVERARVTRLERSRLAPSAAFAPTCFDLFTSRSVAPWEARNRSCVGLPKLSQGTLLLWLAPPEAPPPDDAASGAFVQRLVWDLREFATFLERAQPTQRVLVAAPAAIGESGRRTLADFVARILGERVELLLHAHPIVPDGLSAPRSRRWLVFVDCAGVVRALSELPSGRFVVDDHAFMRWLNVFRDHGRPPRELPELERPKPGGPGDPEDGGR